DLTVREAWSFRDDFEGDWDGEGTFPGSHERGSDRRELTCLWVAESDVWRCPTDQPAPGRGLFTDPAQLVRTFGRRPW
ncbi:MAG: hypothetical protein AB7P00_33145, partial [Sandaracinaceae bacterium]